MIRKINNNWIRWPFFMIAALSVLTLFGCEQIQRPEVEPFYAASDPPRTQELRWSNGKSPSSFDPALAAAPPETDLIRAIYEGLTELDSRSLDPVPAVAKSWRSSKDRRSWTFELRPEAKWSNGEPITAQDFVRSWQRLIDLGEKTVNNHLFQNIVGMNTWATPNDRPGGEVLDFLRANPADRPAIPLPDNGILTPRTEPSATPAMPLLPPGSPVPSPQSGNKTPEKKFGVMALDDHTLQVELYMPDKDFPKLVANPIFRPVYRDVNFENSPTDPEVPTNGSFQIAAVESGSITLGRSENYWNKEAVALERVRMVAAPTAEDALDAYKKGEVDIVTNAAFEPLAVKLLTPYDDFRRTAHNAVNFYEVNTDRYPFSDRRVRQALALSIDREKLAEGDLQGTTQAAHTFSPLLPRRPESPSHDVRKANELLEKAGYPEGSGFPLVRLVINRNDVQQRVAASVTRMWKQNLNIESEIVVKETAEMEEVRRSGDFDLLRRGVVLPTNDELVNLTAVHGLRHKQMVEDGESDTDDGDIRETEAVEVPSSRSDQTLAETSAPAELEATSPTLPYVLDEALFEMTAIPLYFPVSYCLVKPYVRGFELNGLDAPTLKNISIDNNWQPNKARSES